MAYSNGTTSNGTAATQRRPFHNGVYCPLITPFTSDDGEARIDVPALEKQVLRMAKAGMGIVLLGTNGEASHQSDAERSLVISSSRQALDNAGYTSTPLLVGTGGGSALHTISLTRQAAEAGADYSIVICPGYFAFAMAKNRKAIKDFFVTVFDNSPIPVMIYNFPGAASGIDLDSDLLIELSEHPNCFGVKLTCAAIGKGHRIAAHTQSKAYLSRHSPFQVLPGFSDYLLPALTARHTGCITGTGNVFPKLIVKLYNTAVEALKTGDAETMKQALDLQDKVSTADWIIVKAGIGGTKYALDSYVEKGLGGKPRQPLPPVDEATMRMVDNELRETWEYEQSL